LRIQNRSGISTVAGVAIVVILLVIAAGAYYYIAYVSPSSSTTTTPTTTSTTAGPLPGKGMSIGVVFDVGGLGDRGFNDLADQGMLQANKTLGVDYKYEIATSVSDIPGLFAALIQDHLNLIVGVGFDDDQAIAQYAAQYPNQMFAQVDGDEYNFTNVIAIKFTENVGSAIVGALAAAEVGNGNKIGFLGGVSVGIIYKFWNGFKYGVEWADSYITNTTGKAYTNTLDEVYDSAQFTGFADASGGYTNGQAMIARGDKLIYTAAGGTGIGTFNAIGQYDKQQGWDWSNSNPPPVWAIGVDANQDYYGTQQFFSNANSSSTSSLSLTAPSFILTSEIKGVNTGVYDVASWMVDGNFSGVWNNPTKFGPTYYNGQTQLCGANGDAPCHVKGVLLLGYPQHAVGPTAFQYTSEFLTPLDHQVLTQIENGILNGSIRVPEIYTDTGYTSLL
jgi:basic membrane protein A and related proteins